MKLLGAVKFKRSLQLVSLAGTAGLLATGCQTYQQQNKVIINWQQGNLPGAVVEAKKQADDNADNKDTVIWRLEQGAVLRAAGQFADSNDAFDRAQAKIDDYAQKAKVRVGQEAGALLSNQANLAYEGRAYDGIMLNTYKALNYLALGDPDKARPEIIRAYEREQDAVEANKKRIQETQDAAQKTKDKEAIAKAQSDQKFQSQVSGVTANLDGLQAYANYVNPFTVYLDGLYFLVNAADASDLERAHKSFERVTAFAPDNDFVKQDLAAVEQVMDGRSLPPTTYVIFETGCAPVRGQIRVDIPIIVSRVSYVGAAFPTLKLQDNYLPQLTATYGDTSVNTKLVASLDSVIGLDFKNELPVVITKTIAATVTKAVAAYAINEAANQQSWEAGLLAQVATAGYQAAVNIADERTWTTLPKEIQVARFPTPADHKLVLSGPGGSARTEVTLSDSTVNLVYVKSINAATPLLVTQMKMNGSPIVTSAPIHVPIPMTNVESNPPAPAIPAAADNGGTPAVSPAPAVPALTATNPPAATDIATNHQAEANPAPDPTLAPATPPAVAPAAAAEAPVLPAPATAISNPEVASLCATLKSDNPRLVIKALKDLRQLYCPEAVPQVLLCLDHYNVNVIRDACRTLAVIGDKSVIPSLQPLLLHRRADVRRDAQMAIYKLQAKS